MNASRVLVTRSTNRAAWSRRLMLAARALDRAIAWKLAQEHQAEARARAADRQRRHRRRQRAASRAELAATFRAQLPVPSRSEAPRTRRGNP